MKKYILLLTCLFLSQTFFGQTEYEKVLNSLNRKERKTVQNSEPCIERIKEAIVDFQNKEGKYFVIGDLTNWDVTYDWHMNNVLEITTETVGCVSSYWEGCYNLYADMKIKEIYGKEIFNRLESETDSLYKIGLGVEDCRFNGTASDLNKYIYCNLNLPNSLIIDKIKVEEKISVNIRFDVDSTGEVSNPVIYFVANTKNKDLYKAESIRIIENMERWIPARRYGKRIKDRGFLTIHFDPIQIEKFCED